MKRVAFLVSGSGTNMENLAIKMKAGEIKADPVIVISNKPDVRALDRAKNLSIEGVVVESKKYKTREDFEKVISQILEFKKVDLIVLAGFMRVLTEGFVRQYRGRMINIHPSLLPAFPGANGIKDAFEAKVKETGVTVHFVTEGVDTGPIILQSKVPIMEGDTLEALEARVHATEYEIFPAALKLVLDGRVTMDV